MDKRILLPTDFSANALNAVRYAQNLYENQYCDFYLLNVFQVNTYSLENMMVPEPGNPAYDAAKAKSEEGFVKLEKLLDLNEPNPKHTFHTISSFNSLSEAIRGTIAKKDIDLVIMGTKGMTDSKNAIFGTNTVNIMEKIVECPVMAIPSGFRFSPPKEIVFPTDYKTDFKRRELKYLLEIVKLHGSRIQVLHVERRSKLSKTQINNKELLEDILHGVDFEHHILTNVKVQEGIVSFIEEHHCDMVVFVNKKHWFFGSILSNPLVKELGYDATTPVLELNDNT